MIAKRGEDGLIRTMREERRSSDHQVIDANLGVLSANVDDLVWCEMASVCLKTDRQPAKNSSFDLLIGAIFRPAMFLKYGEFMPHLSHRFG